MHRQDVGSSPTPLAITHVHSRSDDISGVRDHVPQPAARARRCSGDQQGGSSDFMIKSGAGHSERRGCSRHADQWQDHQPTPAQGCCEALPTAPRPRQGKPNCQPKEDVALLFGVLQKTIDRPMSPSLLQSPLLACYRE